MGCFLLPVGLCEHIEALITRLWWGGKNGERKIHWTHWSKLCDPKKEGGMGFRNFRSFNLAILAKQGWRMLHEPESLMAKTLKARYFPRKNVLAAMVGFTPSYTWRSIHESLWVLQKGGYWRIGQGFDVYIWRDCWIPTQNGNKLWSPPTILEEDARVVELIDSQNFCWKETLIRECFYPFEAAQILAIPLSAQNREDKFCWQGTKNGIYSAKTAYHMIRNVSSD